MTFSIGKLQKLALSFCAWNFVSFLSICRLPHHPCIERWSRRHQEHRRCGSLANYELGKLPRRSDHGRQSPKCHQLLPLLPQEELLVQKLLFMNPVARQFWRRIKCENALASPTVRLAKQCLGRSFVIEKVCMYSI